MTAPNTCLIKEFYSTSYEASNQAETTSEGMLLRIVDIRKHISGYFAKGSLNTVIDEIPVIAVLESFGGIPKRFILLDTSGITKTVSNSESEARVELLDEEVRSNFIIQTKYTLKIYST